MAAPNPESICRRFNIGCFQGFDAFRLVDIQAQPLKMRYLVMSMIKSDHDA
jgi:hypothetical protein